MERIQAAIQKAKEQRETAAPRRRRAVRPAERWPAPRPAGPVWAALAAFAPDPALMRTNRIVTFERSDPVHATFDMMRTKTLRLMREKGWTSLGVTSPTTGCGKTTLVANLAFSLAHQPDMRTVVIDIDLRRPALAGCSASPSRSRWRACCRATARSPRTSSATATTSRSAPAPAASAAPRSSCSTPRPAGCSPTSRPQFHPDIVLYDLPPMLVSDDVLAFLPHLDCVLLVAAAERSRIDEIDKCEQDLAEHTNVLGVVLNKCRYPGEDYGYY